MTRHQYLAISQRAWCCMNIVVITKYMLLNQPFTQTSWCSDAGFHFGTTLNAAMDYITCLYMCDNNVYSESVEVEY